MLNTSFKRTNKQSIRLLKIRDANIARRVEERKKAQEAQAQSLASNIIPRYVTKNLAFLRFTFVKDNRTMTRVYQYMKFIVWLNQYLTSYYVRYTKYSTMLLGLVYKKQVPVLLSKRSFGHGYHLVNVSPWPILLSFSLFGVMLNLAMFFHKIPLSYGIFCFAFINLLIFMYAWFKDIVIEGTYEGHHTKLVQRGIKIGMILFILSEVMFFFSFFWGFFHSSLSPAIQIGGIWPPLGIQPFDPWEVPLLNTLILLTSGVTVTWAHYAVGTKFQRTWPRHEIIFNLHLNVKFEQLLQKAANIGTVLNLKKIVSLHYYRNFKPVVKSKFQHLYPMLHATGVKRVLFEKANASASPLQLDVFGYHAAKQGKSDYSVVELGVSDYFFRRRFCENLDDAFFELYFLYRLKKNLKFFFSEFEYMDARVFPDAWLHEYSLDFIKYDNVFSLIWYRLKQLKVPYMQQYVIFCHNSLIETAIALFATIGLGVLFTGLQLCEYLNAPFTIADSVYGSTFFLTTGFHGLHVLVGTLFLLVCYKRLLLGHFTKTHHVGLECAIWYWHFVDVVWLGVYLSVYHWGGAL